MMKLSVIEFIENMKTKYFILVLSVAIFAVYASTLNNEFVWDDNTFINWELTRSFGNMPEMLKGALPAPHSGDFRPVKGLILTIDYHLFGTDPFYYHLQAIFIHIFSSIFVFLIILFILKSKLFSLFGALIFALHPVNTEAITFVTSSSDILGISFLFCSIYFYLEARLRGIFKWGKYFTLSLLFAILGFVTYETALTLPLILVLYEICFREKENRQLVFRKTKIILVYFLTLALFLVFRFGVLSLEREGGYLESNVIYNLLVFIKALGLYIKLIFLPFGQNVDHTISSGILAYMQTSYFPEAIVSQSFLDRQVLVSLLAILFLVSIALFSYFFKLRLVTFGIFLFFISLAPVSSLVVPLQTLFAERYLYLGVFGFALIISYFAQKISETSSEFFGKYLRFNLVVFVVFLVGFYSFLTVLRNEKWQNSFSLWSDARTKSPQSVLVANNLGKAYFEAGNYAKAQEFLEFATENNNKNDTPYTNLGLIYLKQENYIKALEAYLKADELNPNVYQTHFQLGVIYGELDKFNAAVGEYNKAIELDKNKHDAHFNLGTLYAEKSKYELAIAEYEKVIRLRPDMSDAYVNLGKVYFEKKSYDLSYDYLEKGLKLDPTNTEARDLISKIEEERGGSR